MENTAKNRQKRGVSAGLTGLCLNLLLGAGKLAAGIISGSVSLTTDGVNNLSDAGSSVVTVSAFALSERKADKEHPYGHGRYEYIASFIIGLLIIIVGAEFLITSIKKIISPEPVNMNSLGIIILSVSIAVKFFMFVFYGAAGKKIESDALKAAAFDSLSDCFVTGVVLAAFVASEFVSFNIDGICGIFVSLAVAIGGLKIVFETMNKLLGNGSAPELEREICELVCGGDMVVGVHDLRLHDYGPNVRIGSVHAEFDKNLSIVEAHRIIDELEKRAAAELQVNLVIHVDPVDVSDPELNDLRKTIRDVISRYHNSSIHELQLSKDEKNVSFHIKLPQKYEAIKTEVLSTLTASVRSLYPDFTVDVEFDIIYR